MINIRWILITFFIVLFTSCGTNEDVNIHDRSFDGKRNLNIAQFNDAIKSISPERITELNDVLRMIPIPQIQILFQNGKLTSEELVKYYLWRINQYDLDKLNSVTELNPNALKIARQFDEERKTGKIRSSLHGTAVLLKDVIGTADKMHNTAGAIVLQNVRSNRDAFIVKKLRDAGVVILGKTALSEWSGFMSLKPAFGYSSLGGQVLNPYNKEADPGGSSTGSAVAAVANFATFTIGVESFGSLILPAVDNGCATLKPSLGLVSRSGVIPQLDSQDVVGPMTRNVTDLSLVMDVITGKDNEDLSTTAAKIASINFPSRLDPDGLKGLRVGILPNTTPSDEPIHSKILDALEAAGAQVIELPELPNRLTALFTELDPVYAYGTKIGVEKYLVETDAPVKTIKEIVKFNAKNMANRAKYGQEYLQMTADSSLSAKEYQTITQSAHEREREIINTLFEENQLDIIAGTHLSVINTVYYPVAGYPALAIQAGYRSDGSPVGFILTGRLFEDVKLLNAGYALEQRIKIWHPPVLD